MSPIDSASNTVVMPAATICASWVSTAEADGQSTPGRGLMCFSRLSVCSSISPGSSSAPSRSCACGRLLVPAAMSAMTPSRISRLPWIT